jgi:GTP:adenosylcobinamide-phosphate guanylyltransferase
MRKITAGILGGGRVEEWFANEGAANKGMLTLAGKPSIVYVIEALRASKDITEIILVGDNYPDDIRNSVDVWMPDSGSMKGNIDKIFATAHNDFTLLTTSDVPLVNEITYQGVIDGLFATERDFDLALPIITKKATMEKYPGTKRTFVRIKDGVVKVGNIFLLKTDSYAKIEPIVEETGKRRKSAVKQALQLGIGFIFKLIFGLSSLAELEKKVGKILKSEVFAPILPFPELGVDVDKLSDLEFCRKILENKK